MKYRNLQSGYALFTSIVLTGMLVIVAYATINFSLKRLLLATSGAESHIALYNAEAGVECGLFWDLKNPNNPTLSAFDVATPGTITCGGTTITPTQVVIGGAATSTFQINIDSGCAIVSVGKNSTITTIESRGFNVCSGTGLRFERGVRITY